MQFFHDFSDFVNREPRSWSFVEESACCINKTANCILRMQLGIKKCVDYNLRIISEPHIPKVASQSMSKHHLRRTDHASPPDVRSDRQGYLTIFAVCEPE